MKIIKLIILVIGLLYYSNIYSQIDSIQYTADFKFTTGIYRTYEEFKSNTPSIREKAIITDNPITQFVIGNISTAHKISYIDSSGNAQKLKRKEVWGFCSNGAVYILFNNKFHRIFKIGAITHFIESSNTIFYNRRFQINKPVRTVQYLLDYETGEVSSFFLDNFLLLLKRDEALHKEFLLLKKKSKKKKQMFIYLTKFNERNPIYIKNVY